MPASKPTGLEYLDTYLNGQFNVEEAFKICSELDLIFYQKFYHAKKTSCNGVGIWALELRVKSGSFHCCRATFNRDKSIFVESRDPNDLFDKCLKIEEGWNAGKTKRADSRFCCPLAEKQDCVCVISWTCPVHGSRCIGSHD